MQFLKTRTLWDVIANVSPVSGHACACVSTGAIVSACASILTWMRENAREFYNKEGFKI